MSAKSQTPHVRRVVASAYDWHLSGVNVFMANLFRELRKRGWETTFALTNPTIDASELALPPEDTPIVRFPKTSGRAIRKRQSMLGKFLRAQAPCIYLPNYDFETAGIIPTLPRHVATVGILHSDEAPYYEFAINLGEWMDALVPVSEEIARLLATRAPDVIPRVHRIPYGVPVRSIAPKKPTPLPIRVVYAGRLSRYQKRVHDLAKIISRCDKMELPVEFDIAGDGPDNSTFINEISRAVAFGRARLHGTLKSEALQSLMDAAHVLVLTSEFEGLPVSLLEGMEAGCVPVVSRSRSGISELVSDHSTGLTFDVGDIDGAIDCLKLLVFDPRLLEALARGSRERLLSSDWTLEKAADCYERLFDSVSERRLTGVFAPRPGRAFIPFHHRWRVRSVDLIAKIIRPFRPSRRRK